ncbi:MAG TPA: phosphoribosylamine--glycine ligase, partial [Candidatus Polarisedimenticolaceae bacterium]|nr:phosphoribosylamine--glycine ligase [Candidatus Polarisedimenticolaceae bacterium]
DRSMRVLLVGSGGRESALAWALSRSRRKPTLASAPGNAGIERHARRIPIAAEDVEALVSHARQERYELVVVGPEVPLTRGLADRLRAEGIPVFGPEARAAEVEGSKAFSKAFMERHRIPTARSRTFDELSPALQFLDGSDAGYPLVVKADGLAAGKGVVIADDAATARAAATSMLSGAAFGDAGRRIVVEEMLRGREVSYFALSDGERFVELAPCQDYKRVGDGDRGPNTGGMGTYSPSAWLDEKMRDTLARSIVAPTIEGLAAEGRPFRGVLFVGLMLTASGPKVLEYNARFGDPETQVLLPRLDGDWLDLLEATARGDLRGARPAWKDDAAVCVVMASRGYPESSGKGDPIDGLDAAEALPGVAVFHAGTARDASGRIVTAGGRVLGVTATGPGIAAARARAYEAVSRIRWDGEHHRSDIAADAVSATRGA